MSNRSHSRRARRSPVHQEVLVSPLNGQRGCHGKRQYGSYRVAKPMAENTNRARDGASVEPYKCHHCGFWHLGTNHRQRRK